MKQLLGNLPQATFRRKKFIADTVCPRKNGEFAKRWREADHRKDVLKVSALLKDEGARIMLKMSEVELKKHWVI